MGPSLSPQTHRMRKHAVLALTGSGRVTAVCPSRPGLGRRKRPALRSARRLSCSPGVTLRPLCPLSDTPANNLTIYLKTKQQPSRGDSLMPSPLSLPLSWFLSPRLVPPPGFGSLLLRLRRSFTPSLMRALPRILPLRWIPPSDAPMCSSLTHLKKKKKKGPLVTPPLSSVAALLLPLQELLLKNIHYTPIFTSSPHILNPPRPPLLAP